MSRSYSRSLFAALLIVFTYPLFAQQGQSEPDLSAQAGVSITDGLVTFTSDFFSRYQPNTALEMVNRVPGFILNDGSGWSPGAAISLADNWSDIEYNIAFDTRWAHLGDPGVIDRYDSTGQLTEIRTDYDEGDGPNANAYLNAATWIGKSFVQFNGRTGIENRDLGLYSKRENQLTGGVSYQDILTIRRNTRLELGLDAERILNPVLLGKAIVLYNQLDGEPSQSQRDLTPTGLQTRYRLEDEEFTSSEFITRMETPRHPDLVT
jgi:hypothetical protein